LIRQFTQVPPNPGYGKGGSLVGSLLRDRGVFILHIQVGITVCCIALYLVARVHNYCEATSKRG